MKKPVIEHFDDISDIHREVPGYKYCIRVDFKEGLPDAFEETQAYFEQMACIVVFGDQAPKDILCDWRDDDELWLRYNVGLSVPTLRPAVENKLRVQGLAAQEAKWMKNWTEKDIASYLEHFNGFPRDDDDDLRECEIEVYIEDLAQEASPEEYMKPDYERWQVVMAGKVFKFKTDDEAYFFLCANYNVKLHELGVI